MKIVKKIQIECTLIYIFAVTYKLNVAYINNVALSINQLDTNLQKEIIILIKGR